MTVFSKSVHFPTMRLKLPLMSEISSLHSVTVDFVWGKMEKIIFDFGESNSPG